MGLARDQKTARSDGNSTLAGPETAVLPIVDIRALALGQKGPPAFDGTWEYLATDFNLGVHGKFIYVGFRRTAAEAPVYNLAAGAFEGEQTNNPFRDTVHPDLDFEC